TASGTEIRQITPAWLVAYSPDSRTIAVANDNTVRFYDVATGQEAARPLEQSSNFGPFTFSPDGKTLVTSCYDKTIRFWDVATRKERLQVKSHDEYPVSIAFSPDGKTLATCGSKVTEARPWDRRTAIRLWDATTGKEIREFKGHPDIYSSIAFSRDGKLLAAGGVRGRIQLWDVATGKEPNLPPASDSLRSVAFTPDGEKLVSWGSRTGVPGDGEAIIFWNPSGGRELRRFSDYTAKVSSVALSPQGKIAAVGTWLDTKISLVDLATGKKLRELPDSHYGPMAFTSDGQILLTADYNPPVIH